MAVELASAYVSLSADTSRIPKDVRKALGEAERTAGSSGQSIGNKLSSGISATLKKGALAAGAAAGTAIGYTLTKGFERLSAIEQAEAKLTGLGNSAQDVSKIMDNALNAVKGTAYGMGDAASVAATMVAAGIKPGQELEGVLKTVGDTASISGRSLTDMGLIFSSVAAKGKLQGDDMLQLMESGVPVLQLLADETGKTSAEVSDMVSNSEVDFATFERAMKRGMGGAALEAGNTFKGAMDNAKAAIGRLGEALLKGPFETAPGVISKVTEGIDGLTDKTKVIMDYLSTGQSDIWAFSGESAWVKAFGSQEEAQRVVDAIDTVKGKWQEFRDGMTTGDSSSAIGNLGVDVGRIGDAFAAAWPSIERIGKALGEAGLKASFVSLASLAGALAPILERILVPALEKLADVMEENPKLVEAVVFAFVGFKTVKAVSGPVLKFAGVLKKVGGAAKATGGFLKAVPALFKGMGAAAKAPGGALKNLVTFFTSGTRAAAPLSKAGGVMAKVFGALKAPLGFVSKLLKPLGSIFGKLLGPVAKVTGSLGAKGLLGTIGKFGLKMIPFVGWILTAVDLLHLFFTKTELGKKIWQGIVDFLGNAWNWLKDSAVSIFGGLADFFSGLWDGIKNVATTVWDAITGFLSDSWNRLRDLATSVWQGISDFFSGIWNGLKNIVVTAWTAVTDWLSETWGSFTGWVGETWGTIIGTITGWWDKILTGFQLTWTNVTTWLGEVWAAFSGWVGGVWSSIVGTITGWWNNILYGFQVTWNNVTTWLGEAWAGFTGWVSGVWQNIVNVVTGTWGWIVGGIQNVWNTVSGWLAGVWASFTGWVSGVWNGISNTITGIWQAMGDRLSGIWEGIKNGISAGFDRIVQIVSGVKDRILNAVSDAGQWLVQAGKWVVEGLINGIKSKISDAGNAIKEVGSTVVSVGSKVLGIGSPSRIFKQYGRWVGDGLIIGLNKSEKGVRSAAESMANQVSNVSVPTIGAPAVEAPQAPDVAPSRPAAPAAPVVSAPAAPVVDTSAISGAASTIQQDATGLIDPAIQGMDAGITGFGQAVTDTVTGVVGPMWTQMTTALTTAKTTFIDPMFSGMGMQLSNLGMQFGTTVNSWITPAWNFMGTMLNSVKTGLVDPAFGGIMGGLNNVGGTFFNAVNGTIVPVWQQMGGAVMGVWSGTVAPAFNAIAGGIANTVNAFANGATGIANQWNRVREATAAPVRFAINSVFNDGIVGMWNSASDLLGTNKMGTYPVRFATGGYVRGPGGPKDDKIPAMLSDKEYVVNAAAVKKIGVKNLNAINSGAPIAQQAYKSDLPRLMDSDRTWNQIASRYASGGPVKGTKAWEQMKRGYDWARKLNGRPYVLGGDPVGGGGTDCSGYMSSIADRIQGGAGHRQWATMAFNGGGNGQAASGPQGFIKGLGAGFSIGVLNGGAAGGHTAGTLGPGEGFPATNVESGGSHGNVAFGGPAVGADNGQFPTKYHLPFTEGGFVSGGSGGGATVSMADLISEAAKPYKDKMNAAVKAWGNRAGMINEIPARIADKLGGAADKKMSKLAEELDAVSGAAAGVDISGISGDVQNQVRAVFARAGWTGKQWEDAAWIIGKESGWNPTARNPSSGAFGLFQFLGATKSQYLPDENPNPAVQARAGQRYIKDRYGTPSAARAFWESHNWYDSGGYLEPGVTVSHNDTSKPEPVFTASQWQVLKANIFSSAKAGDFNRLQENLGVLANGLEQAVAKLDWNEVFGAASKAFNESFMDGQMSDIRSVFGLPDYDAIPAVKAMNEFNEAEKKASDEAAEAAKSADDAEVSADRAEAAAGGAPVPASAAGASESNAVGARIAETGALVAKAIQSPNPASVGAAANSGGQTINFIVQNQDAAMQEYRKWQAKNSRGTVGAR